jgi:hypothetical protein
MVIFLVVNVLIQPAPKSPLQMQLNKWSHIGLQGQVCIIYMVSAIYKWGSSDWINGTILVDTLSVRPFGNWSDDTLVGLSPLFIAAAYFTLFYQTAFACIIWFRRIKKWTLIIGVAMHLGIILLFGLVEFGLVMILGYVVFLPDRWSEALISPLRKHIKT